MSASGPVLSELRLESFRCFESVSLEPASGFNVIAGGNASGKTSLLEAIYFLGRGISFRVARADGAIRFADTRSTLFGLLGAGRQGRVGVEIARGDGVAIRVNGNPGTRADLVEALPVQIIDPSSHELVTGPPATRRQFMDWGVFHVEPSFLGSWRRYRRGLQQRNAALRGGYADSAWLWDKCLETESQVIDACRRRFLDRLKPLVQEVADRLLSAEISVSYQSGWLEGTSLGAALEKSRERDVQMGTTTNGPHRADLRISLRNRRAKESVSRGQEKLIAASLTLAQLELVAGCREQHVVLLLDEPGADLDREHLKKLLASVASAPAQAFVTSLDPDALVLPPSARMFHVEHSRVRVLL